MPGRSAGPRQVLAAEEFRASPLVEVLRVRNASGRFEFRDEGALRPGRRKRAQARPRSEGAPASMSFH